jgi:membrane protein
LSDQLTRSVLKAPGFWGGLAVRAFTRSWGRDVMLYTGGVSFFALLAVFPAIAILIGVYKLGLSINEVSAQAAALSDLLPRAAQTIFHDEIARLAKASARTVSAQSAFALFVGAYAAHRGFKALLAGLNLIHDETEPHGFFKFNLLAFFVAIFAFALFTVVSGAVVTARILAHAASPGARGDNAGLMPLDALLPALGLVVGLTLLYRYAMSHRTPVAWLPSITGGLVATLMSVVSSSGSDLWLGRGRGGFADLAVLERQRHLLRRRLRDRDGDRRRGREGGTGAQGLRRGGCGRSVGTAGQTPHAVADLGSKTQPASTRRRRTPSTSSIEITRPCF